MALRNVAIEANDDEQRREDVSGSHGGHILTMPVDDAQKSRTKNSKKDSI